MRLDFKGFFVGIIVGLILFSAMAFGAVADRIKGFNFLDSIINRQGSILNLDQKLLKEESVVIDVAEKASPSVVTVSVKTQGRRVIEFSPFGGFQQRFEDGKDQDIGTGFIIREDGLIVTNKHVV